MTCAMDGCDDAVFCRGWCRSCYTRARRWGHPSKAPGTRHGEPKRLITQRLAGPGDDECWEWPYTTDSKGYGRVWQEGRMVFVHRLVMELIGDPIPSDMDARHLCGNGHLGCWNPAHIGRGTHAENLADRVAHGTMPVGERHANSTVPSSVVTQIRELNAAGESQVAIARRLGLRAQYVGKVVRNERRRAG